MTDTPAPTSAPIDDEQIVFSIYDGNTGRISVRGTSPRSMANIQPRALHEGMIFEHLDGADFYVDVTGEEHVPRSRPTLAGFDKLTIKADGIDAASLTMPVAGQAIIDREVYAVEHGVFALRVDHPGSYEVTIQAFPYRDVSATITATA